MMETPQSVFVSLGDESDQFYSDFKLCAFQNGVALLFATSATIINFFVLAIIHERAPRTQRPLPDLSFDILPEAAWGLQVAEYIITVEFTLVVLLLFLHKHRVILFRRLCIILGIVYLARAISMSCTQVPLIKQGYCREQMTPEQYRYWSTYITVIFERVFHMLLGFGLSINGRHDLCGDYIFSGHTTILTFCYLFLREYLMPKNTWRSLFWASFRAILFSSSLVGVILILVARGHYLIDVVIAYFITSSIFYIYHTLVYNKSLRYATQKNLLSRFWWWPLMKYLEYDHIVCCITSTRSSGTCLRCESINTEVPRKFDWPLRWTKSTDRRSTSLQRLLSQA